VPDFLRARELAEAVQTAVRGTTRLTCSLGVASSKVVAKVASDRRKPGGITVVLPGREGEFLGPLAVRKLPGIGPRSAERLARVEIDTVGALAELDDDTLRGLLPGKVGRMLRDRARGVDPRRLETDVARISISQEETFPRDIDDRARLHDELRRMAADLAEHLCRNGQVGRTVTTKVRYPDFSIRTRSLTLDVAVADAETIGDVACRLLDRALEDRPGALRLVGVGVRGLEEHAQLAIS